MHTEYFICIYVPKIILLYHVDYVLYLVNDVLYLVNWFKIVYSIS